MPKTGDIFDVVVYGMNLKGEAVGDIDGLKVFVSGAIPGEKVKARVDKIHKNYIKAGLLEVTSNASPNRITPECELFGICGGCAFMHLEYGIELDVKRHAVADCFDRIAGARSIDVKPVIGASGLTSARNENIEPVAGTYNRPFLRYRNNSQLHVGLADGAAVIGQYSLNSHDIVGISNCLLQNAINAEILRIIKIWMTARPAAPYDSSIKNGAIKNIIIRNGENTGEIMVIIVSVDARIQKSMTVLADMLGMVSDTAPYIGQGSRPETTQCAEPDTAPRRLAPQSETLRVKSLVLNVNSGVQTVGSPVMGAKNIVVRGSGHITEKLLGNDYRISPGSFFQINTRQAEVMYKNILECLALTGSESILDLYCGTGGISIYLAKYAKRVLGIEMSAPAIFDGIGNIKLNKADNVELIQGRVEIMICDLINKNAVFDAVVLDPPRKGCDRELTDALAKLAPPKIVYASCDPATQARDIKLLLERGYEVKCVQPIDMFPRTGHIETVALLRHI